MRLPHRLRRTAGVLRRAAREPETRPRLRRDLNRVWRASGPAPVIRVAAISRDRSAGTPLRDVRALLVAEPFVAQTFAPEWRQTSLTPESWRASLAGGADVLVVTTQAMVTAPWVTVDVLPLVAACADAGVPVVVWDTAPRAVVAVLAASLGQVAGVRTVYPDRVAAWHDALPGATVEVLGHGVQPRLFGPADAARTPAVGLVVDGPLDLALQPVLVAAEAIGLSVFGRRADLQFPGAPSAHRLAGPATTDALRSAFRRASAWFVPLRADEPVPASVLGLAASQTPFVTGANAAVATMFGDLVPGSEVAQSAVTEPDVVEIARSLRAYSRQPELRDRVGLELQRTVLAAHTAGHRVDALLSAAGLTIARPRRQVSAVVPTNRPGQLDHVLGFIARQDYPDLQLVLVLHGVDEDPSLGQRAKDLGIGQFVVVRAPESVTLGACMNLGVDASDGDVIAKMDDDNVYGRAYLTDLVNAFDYTDAGVVGKLAHYVHLTSSQAVLLRAADQEHRYVRLVQGGSMVMQGDLVREARFEDVPRAVDTTFLDKVGARGVRVYSADRFNYVSVRRSGPASHTWQVSDLEMLSTADARLCFYGDPMAHIDV